MLRRRSIVRHVIVGGASVCAVLLIIALTELSTEDWGRPDQLKRDGLLWQFNVATGTVAVALLVVTLSIHPLRTLRGRTTPVHLPWRRATGVWSAVLVAAHIPGGLAIHSSGWRVWTPFESVVPGVDGRPLDEFTLGYWIGLVAALTLVPLVVTSTEASLRRRGAANWKRLHRLIYATYALAAVHVVALQYGESRDLRHVALIALVFGAAIVVRAVAAVSSLRGRTAVPPGVPMSGMGDTVADRDR